MTLAHPVTPSPVTPLRLSEQEYLDWVDEGGHTEWVAGEVIFKMPISKFHDLLQRAIAASLEALVRRRQLGEVRGERWAMRLPNRPAWREADVIFVAAANAAANLTDNRLVGPADLAVEIVSPDSVARDYREKYLEYEAAGVGEYWIVDPLAKVVEAHARNAEGRFAPIAPDDAGKLHSRLVRGWWLQADLLFKEPTPDALELIQALGIT